MKVDRHRTIVLALVGCFALPAAAAAQQSQPEGQQPPALETELVFDREVFEYPSFPRSNPFVPVSIDDQGGPRYEQLSLTGIIWDPDPTFSVR